MDSSKAKLLLAFLFVMELATLSRSGLVGLAAGMLVLAIPYRHLLLSKRFLIPLAIFIVLAGFLYRGLFLNPREVPSPFIGKPAPAFQLAQLHAPDRAFTQKDLLGQVWLLTCGPRGASPAGRSTRSSWNLPGARRCRSSG